MAADVAARIDAPKPPAKKLRRPPVEGPWELAVGRSCTFYHEGGHGEKHWVVGWRYGIIRHIPVKGAKKGWVHIEVPVRLYGWDGSRYVPKPNLKAWCHASAVNSPGDYVYHGRGAVEVYREKQAIKAEQQLKAEKRKRAVSK